MIEKLECGCAHDGSSWIKMCVTCRTESDRLHREFLRGLKLDIPTTRLNDREVITPIKIDSTVMSESAKLIDSTLKMVNKMSVVDSLTEFM